MSKLSISEIIRQGSEKFHFPFTSVEAVAKNLDIDTGFYTGQAVCVKDTIIVDAFAFIGYLYYCGEMNILYKLTTY